MGKEKEKEKKRRHKEKSKEKKSTEKQRTEASAQTELAAPTAVLDRALLEARTEAANARDTDRRLVARLASQQLGSIARNVRDCAAQPTRIELAHNALRDLAPLAVASVTTLLAPHNQLATLSVSPRCTALRVALGAAPTSSVESLLAFCFAHCPCRVWMWRTIGLRASHCRRRSAARCSR